MPSRSWLVAAVLAVAACGGEETGPVTGTLQVSLTTSGDGSDPDGYLVLVNHTVQRPAPANGTVDVEALPPGDQEVSLEGLSANCSPQGETVFQVTLAAGDTARVSFEIACLAATGTIRAATSTTGVDLDPSGYAITVDEVSAGPVEPTGTTLVTATAGAHTVSLGGVNGNCAVAEPSTRPVVVPLRGLVDLAFEVVCHDAPAAGRGHEIVYGSGDDPAVLYSVNEDGSRQVRLFPELEASLSAPAWAPDGTRLAFYAFGATIRIEVVDIVAGGRVELPADDNFFFGPSLAWSPDGTRLALAGFTSSSISAIHVDGSGTDEIDFGCCNEAVQSPTWSPDGARIAFVGIEESQVFGVFLFPRITDLAFPGVSEPPPGCNLDDTREVAWSPDGSRLAVASAGHIFILNFQTAECVQITTGPWTDQSPSWSPDGSQLAFSSTRDGNAEIYVMRADGSAQTRITRNSVADVTPTWRP
jgi:hypothetical protein